MLDTEEAGVPGAKSATRCHAVGLGAALDFGADIGDIDRPRVFVDGQELSDEIGRVPMKKSSSRMRRALIQNARSFVSFAVTKRSSSTPLPDTSRRSVYTRKKSESGA